MNNLIFDIGMHTGKDTEFYLKKGFRVVAVEANYKLAEQAKIKFKDEISNGQLVIIDKAIAPYNINKIEFFINEDKDDWGTILPDWNRSLNSNYKSIFVDTVQLESIIDTYGIPYYLKIDIEGADILCLKSLINRNVVPDFVSVELLHPDNFFNQQVDCLELLAHLNVLGYKKFKITDQSKNIHLKSPSNSLEGKYVNFDFGDTSSGLFGKELDSKSYTLDEVAKIYLDYFYNFGKPKPFIRKIKDKIINRIGNKNHNEPEIFHKNGWFDIHAIKL